MSRRLMPHLQLWKGRYRIRAPIREDRRAHFGGRTYYLKALGTSDRREAERLAIDVLAEFQRQCRMADQGVWPPDGPDQTRQIAVAYGGAETPEDAVQAQAALAANRACLREALADFLRQPFGEGHTVAEALADLRIYPEGQAKPAAFPSAPSEPYPFDTLIDAWALERNVRPRSKADAKTAARRLKQFLGHDDTGA